MSSLAERIRSARVDAGIEEPAELARRVGVKPAAVYQWESGDTKSLKAETALALESALRVNVRWLVNGRGARSLDAGQARGTLDGDLLRQAVAEAERQIAIRGLTSIITPEDRAEVVLIVYSMLQENIGIKPVERIVGGMLRAIARGAKVS